MKPELIVMLTHNDQTVDNAIELFENAKDLPASHWGFKDIGLPPDKIKLLVNKMKQSDKTTYLEVVSLSEEEGLAGATFAVDFQFDVLMGTVYYESIHNYLMDKTVKYFPFPGNVHSHPSVLDGTIGGITNHAKYLESQGVNGLDLLTYRFTGDADRLLETVVKEINVPIVSAGSIDSYERIDKVCKSGAWGFTIGSAFFESKFVKDGSFFDNVQAVINWLERNCKE